MLGTVNQLLYMEMWQTGSAHPHFLSSSPGVRDMQTNHKAKAAHSESQTDICEQYL